MTGQFPTLILILLLLAQPQQPAQPQSPESTFNRAAELQRQGRFAEAAEAYRAHHFPFSTCHFSFAIVLDALR
jgi:hypothetical protein